MYVCMYVYIYIYVLVYVYNNWYRVLLNPRFTQFTNSD